MPITGRQFIVAFGIAVLIHAALAAAVFWVPPPPGATASGLGGIEVSLGPVGGAPGSVAAPVATAMEVPDATVPEVPIVEAPDIPLETMPEDVPVEAAQPVEQETAVPIETAAEPAVDDVPPSPPEQVVEAMPVPPPPAAPPTAEALPEPTAPPPDTADIESPPDQVAALAVPSVAGSGGRSGSQDSPEAGSANDVSGGGSPGDITDYMSYLLAWLQKHKEYPKEAQRLHQEGMVLLYVEMDHEGRVYNYRIHQSSGHGPLDDEVLALILRAEPLPPPPEVEGERIKLLVPVEFFLK
jgi:protein TonB